MVHSSQKDHAMQVDRYEDWVSDLRNCWHLIVLLNVNMKSKFRLIQVGDAASRLTFTFVESFGCRFVSFQRQLDQSYFALFIVSIRFVWSDHPVLNVGSLALRLHTPSTKLEWAAPPHDGRVINNWSESVYYLALLWIPLPSRGLQKDRRGEGKLLPKQELSTGAVVVALWLLLHLPTLTTPLIVHRFKVRAGEYTQVLGLEVITLWKFFVRDCFFSSIV